MYKLTGLGAVLALALVAGCSSSAGSNGAPDAVDSAVSANQSANSAPDVATSPTRPASSASTHPPALNQFIIDVKAQQPPVNVADSTLIADGLKVCPTGGSDASQKQMEQELAAYGVPAASADDVWQAAWVDLCTNIGGAS